MDNSHVFQLLIFPLTHKNSVQLRKISSLLTLHMIWNFFCRSNLISSMLISKTYNETNGNLPTTAKEVETNATAPLTKIDTMQPIFLLPPFFLTLGESCCATQFASPVVWHLVALNFFFIHKAGFPFPSSLPLLVGITVGNHLTTIFSRKLNLAGSMILIPSLWVLSETSLNDTVPNGFCSTHEFLHK